MFGIIKYHGKFGLPDKCQCFFLNFLILLFHMSNSSGCGCGSYSVSGCNSVSGTTLVVTLALAMAEDVALTLLFKIQL